MRRFRFRLQSLLRLRGQYERVARKELAIAMAEVHGFDQKLAAAARGLRDFADQAARSDSVGQLARALESGLRRHQWRLTEQRKVAEQALETVRIAYTQKARELRTLQRLREQQHEAWRTEVLRTEQAELDELATLTHGSSQDSQEGDVAW